MTDGEICREYRAAKHKGQQVEILAQLNRLEEGQVIDILLPLGKSQVLPFSERQEDKTRVERRGVLLHPDKKT